MVINMKHIFILNPAAGHSDITGNLQSKIIEIAQKYGIDTEICKTEYPNHAVKIVSELASNYDPEICRFYACGGDGTLREVASGVAKAAEDGHKNTEFTHFPCGTGNDFIKIFENKQLFSNLDELIDGKSIKLDMMKLCDLSKSEREYAINVCSTGLDARVAHWLGLHKRELPVSGGLAYKLSLVLNFFKRTWRCVECEIDGVRQNAEHTIIVAANARYYGGGFYAVPDAQPNDGFIDFLFVKRLSRPKILQIIGKYEKGLYRELGDIVEHVRGKSVHFKFENPEPINADGEIIVTNEIEISIADEQVTFIMPKSCSVVKTV